MISVDNDKMINILMGLSASINLNEEIIFKPEKLKHKQCNKKLAHFLFANIKLPD